MGDPKPPVGSEAIGEGTQECTELEVDQVQRIEHNLGANYLYSAQLEEEVKIDAAQEFSEMEEKYRQNFGSMDTNVLMAAFADNGRTETALMNTKAELVKAMAVVYESGIEGSVYDSELVGKGVTKESLEQDLRNTVKNIELNIRRRKLMLEILGEKESAG
jgi:hypothetical protein